MTPAARLQSAIEALAEIEGGRRPADAVLDHFFKARRYMGAKDRRGVATLVYDSIRARARLDWHLARAGVPSTPRARILAGQVLAGASAPAVAALFNGAPHCPRPLDEAEARLVQRLDGMALTAAGQPRWVRLEYPEFLDAALEESLGGRLEEEATALNRPAPADLRVNVLRSGRDRAREALAKESVEAEPTPHSPWGLRVAGRTRFGGLESFRRGLVELQDEGSQLIALLTDARPGMTVVDLCAGAGGKTLALAAAMGNQGRVKACDTAAERLQRMAVRLQRAGVSCVDLVPIREGDASWASDLVAERVLVDAPCSGSGIWRRAPDAKWRLTPDGVARVVEAQRRILDLGAGLVAAGGRLVYATCSLLRAENEDQVEAFLTRNRRFRLLPAEQVWPQVAEGACPGQGMLRLGPARTGTDGFFVAILERVS